MCKGRGDDSYLDRVAVDKVERRLFLSSVSNLIMVGNRNFLGGAVGEETDPPLTHHTHLY